ncbi:hypothetical protein KUTeg_021254 [Tegillarca granosa]|uniref:CARD domain-containing protein n=1 Tax=Tegillarca granosa TaxID=220873 RepID=A0ABQ9EEC9_TEGGR|nr:hypothetical protein KUTeg_021254 [Tegillarca granosa]
MNKDQKKLISSNVTFLKDRLRHLDPIIEYLLEKNIITEEQQDQIFNVNPSTQHKKFNEFLSVLLASTEESAFPVFIEALVDSRYYNIVEKLQKDGARFNIRETSFVKATRPKTAGSYTMVNTQTQRSFTSIVRMMKDPEPESEVEAELISKDTSPPIQSPLPPKNTTILHHSCPPAIREISNLSDTRRVKFNTINQPVVTYQETMDTRFETTNSVIADQMTSAFGQIFADFSSKLTNDLLDGFERRRHEDTIKMEFKMEQMIQKHVDERIDDKLKVFRNEWEEEKKKILKRNEHSMTILQSIVDQLNCTNDAYSILKEKYDQIQQNHGVMREKENERWQKLVTANKERTQLKSENEKLKTDADSIKEKMFDMKTEYKNLWIKRDRISILQIS